MTLHVSKFGNRRTLTEEGWFDSKRELSRWGELRLLERAGKIRDLRRQVAFDLLPGCVLGGKRLRPIRYIADFVYTVEGKTKVEDSKGFRHRLYQLKRRMMWQLLGVEVVET